MAIVQFHEVQRANSPLIVLIGLFSPLLMAVILFYQLLTGIHVGNNPVSNATLVVIIIALGLPIILIISRLKLTTIIDSESISYGFNFPGNALNRLNFSDIKECYLTEYRFVGYGYRISRRYGIVYNLKGRQGLQIVKHSGEKIMIGTQKWEELKKHFEKK